VLVVLAAACSGHVEERHESEFAGGTGGTAISPVGGAGGTPVGGSSGGGVGGNFGSAGRYGSGAGGYFGDAGSPSFGGTSNGGAFGDAGTTGFAGSNSCFVAGTRITTPSGTRPIEELRIGDVVLAYDESTGRVVARAVTATFIHPDQTVGALPLSDGRVLRVTANHPIYLPDQQRYADAGELTGDERLLSLSASARTSSMIAGAFQAAAADPVTVYNITVGGEHNYFAEGVLVHNKSVEAGPCTPVSLHGATCSLVPGCLDPTRPTNEYVSLNQLVGADAGPADSGPQDSGPVQRLSTDAGVEIPVPNATASICEGGSVVPFPSFLAFDVSNSLGAPPTVGLYSSDSGMLCSGSQIGEVWTRSDYTPPAFSTTTQCLRVPRQFMTHLTLAALNNGTVVSKPRFVSGCSCPRSLVVNTSCGYQGGPAGSCY